MIANQQTSTYIAGYICFAFIGQFLIQSKIYQSISDKQLNQ
jgi:hypothetical protein